MKLRAATALSTLIILTGCAHDPLPKPWPDEKLENKTYIAPDATVDEAAIHRVFYAAYSRTRVALMGGEDMEAIFANLKDLRTRLGDRDFAAALEKEDPAVRSGVGYFCGKMSAAKFPLSRAVLDKTPDYKFELEKAYEEG